MSNEQVRTNYQKHLWPVKAGVDSNALRQEVVRKPKDSDRQFNMLYAMCYRCETSFLVCIHPPFEKGELRRIYLKDLP